MKTPILLWVVVFFYTGCDVINPDSSIEKKVAIEEEFESGYYYIGNSRKIPIFRSNAIISTQFREGVKAERARSILNDFGLEIFDEFHDGERNLTALLEKKTMVLRLPAGVDLQHYLTQYPKSPDEDYFGSHPDVLFSMPTFSSNDSGNLEYRLIFCDEIVMSPDHNDNYVDDYLTNLGLEILSVSKYGEYKLRITSESSMNTLQMANYLYGKEFIKWAQPNFFALGLTFWD